MGDEGGRENETPELAPDPPQVEPVDKTTEACNIIDIERGETRDDAQEAIDSADQVDHNGRHVVPPQQQRIWHERLKKLNTLLFYNGLGIVFMIPMLVCLILFAQRKTFNAGECRERQTECGFVGNEDAYGLGIRIGVYLQWATWFLITHLLPGEERPIMSTMSVFVASLLIAILVLTFSDNCTYSIEIVVMIFIIVPCGLLNALTKTSRGIQAIEARDYDQEEQSHKEPAEPPSTSRMERVDSFIVSSDHSKGMYGWAAASALLDGFSMAYAAWFWIRMTVGTDETFAQTPCGTSLFFVARVQGAGIPVIGGVISACALLILVVGPFEWLSNKFLSKQLCEWIMIPLFLPILIPLFLPGVFAWVAGIACISLFRRNQEDTEDSSFSSWDFGEKLSFGLMSPLVVICCIIGIELSLHWNNVSQVYSVSSTGQLIPLCAGLFNFVPILWKLMRREFGSKGKEEIQRRTTM